MPEARRATGSSRKVFERKRNGAAIPGQAPVRMDFQGAESQPPSRLTGFARPLSTAPGGRQTRARLTRFASRLSARGPSIRSGWNCTPITRPSAVSIDSISPSGLRELTRSPAPTSASA